MSAYSDYKCGALTEDEYRAEMAREDRRDRAIEDAMWEEYEAEQAAERMSGGRVKHPRET